MGDSASSKVVELRKGAVSTITATPGWVWIVIGGVVLLIVGIVAASAAMHSRRATDDA